MEHFLSSGSAGGHPRVEESKATMPVTGLCLSLARVLSGLMISNSTHLQGRSAKIHII